MELEVTERGDQRVLTTVQVATAYNIDPKALMRNFQRNKEHFVEGQHYYALTGEELKAFKGMRQNDATLKFVSLLYLWTETGAFMLAKSLNSQDSWKAHKSLVEGYYSKSMIERSKTVPALPDEKRMLALENRVREIEQLLQEITLHSGEQLRLQRAVAEKVYSLSYKQSERNMLFRMLYRALKKRYAVGSYRDIKQHELQDALKFIANWQLGGEDGEFIN